MQNGKIIAGIARLALGIGFVGVGVLGIVRALAPVAPVARLTHPSTSRGGLAQYAGFRIEAFRAALHRDPRDPELHLRLARSYNARAMVLAHQEYSDAFPDAFLQDRYPIGHYDTWRRGWFHCDRDGDLRRALHHARQAMARSTARPVHVAALQLIVNVLREQCCDKQAVAVLEQLVALAPLDPVAWFQLSEAYRAVGDLEGYRNARGRLTAIHRRLATWHLWVEPPPANPPTQGFAGKIV